eukprot:snap_masked-scaffold_32-processed-gene-2.33-mRNA-1 protein AED:0.18 eAED:0.23 QI:0/-1/0/1/-1/1/1/0/348
MIALGQKLSTLVQPVKSFQAVQVQPQPQLSGWKETHVESEEVSRYRLGEQVGHGFFATVYSAEDLLRNYENPYLDVLDRYNLAVKRINKRRVPSSIRTSELKILNYLNDVKVDEAENHFTKLQDVFETGDHLCLVFDLLRGGDLFDFVTNHGALNLAHTKMAMKQLLKAVLYLHENNVLHRDIKLENILLASPPISPYLSSTELINQSGLDIQLTDFGYATFYKKGEALQTSMQINPAGTYGYVAPEVLSDRIYTPACDMWGAGCVMYSLLALSSPFPKREGTQGPAAELEAIDYGLQPENWKTAMEQECFGDPQAVDLLNKLLERDYTERISAKEALEHPWFRSSVL